MKVEQLNEKQRAYYEKALSLDVNFAEEYLDSLGEKRESGASRKQKIATLQTRFDAAQRILEAVEGYWNRIGELKGRLEREEVSAKEIDLRLHNLPEVEGVVLRIKGAPRGPRAAIDPEEKALKRLNEGTGKRGRPKKILMVPEEAAVSA